MKLKNIIIHHSLTEDSNTVSWGAIRKYHTETLGWNDIGYHLGIEIVNGSYELLMGRMWNEKGAHTLGRNHDSIGICCVGNYDLVPPPLRMLEKLKEVCQFLMSLYNIPIERIYGHHDFASYKSCPGNLFDLEKFRGGLK